MIDLCIDARMANSSGIGTCIRQIVPLLNHPPFRIILLVRHTGDAWCSKIEQILFPSPIYSIHEQILFPLKIPHCDLFWSPNYNVPLLSIRAKKRAVTIHDACHVALKQLLSLPERLYAKFVMRQALLKSDEVITDSLFSQAELVRFLGKSQKRISVIYPAVNQEYFQRDPKSQTYNDIRKKYHLPENFILYVGNLKPHKNLKGLLKAFSLLPFADLGLVIVGKYKGLRNTDDIPMGQKVFCIGEVLEEELPILYSMAALLVLPSFYEGFGLPPLEAMSCGCPTIVSKAASLPEICGDASLYIDPEKPEEIAQRIVRLIEDTELKNQLICKGYEHVKKFDWNKTADSYRDLFAICAR